MNTPQICALRLMAEIKQYFEFFASLSPDAAKSVLRKIRQLVNEMCALYGVDD